MHDFLAHTLHGEPPAITQARLPALHWQWIDEGILEITPEQPATMALVISAGIHGNETAPVEILNRLITPLLQGDKPVLPRVLVILGNPAALRSNQRYTRIDVNRLFGGRWQQYDDCAEARRAWRLEQAIEHFYHSGCCDEVRWHLDLHTAIRGSYHPRFGVLPYSARPWPADFLQWLGAAGLEALVWHNAPGGTFTHFSCEHFAASSCTLELGKAQPFGSNDLSQFAAAEQALSALLYGEALPAVAQQPRHYQVAQQITRQGAQFQLHIDADTLNFARFSQGALLAEEGERRYVVQHAEEFVLFPNPNVAAGQRAGLMLVETPPRSETQ
ncbi:Succinylglutamate desuccinylase [Duffyella gerundensis]|uniref:Succinylglutamate desuccinylase n=1 Tax=Duffyella gerundensis TaxID=1619313 RepID=A0A0U5GL67_9GAMM|nr:succinylglutamate desuccinylase [Duffyella gerundensis]CUU23873.1 Succinylglutamate desuccinylase [Duffyella gerundensis]